MYNSSFVFFTKIVAIVGCLCSVLLMGCDKNATNNEDIKLVGEQDLPDTGSYAQKDGNDIFWAKNYGDITVLRWKAPEKTTEDGSFRLVRKHVLSSKTETLTDLLVSELVYVDKSVVFDNRYDYTLLYCIGQACRQLGKTLHVRAGSDVIIPAKTSLELFENTTIQRNESITLAWQFIDNAFIYTVYRAAISSDGFVYSQLGQSSETRFEVESTLLREGNRYAFYVQSCNSQGDCSDPSNIAYVGVGVNILATPDTSSSRRLADRVRVAWQDVPLAQWYVVTRAIHYSHVTPVHFEKVVETTTPVFNDMTVATQSNQVATYRVRACRQDVCSKEAQTEYFSLPQTSTAISSNQGDQLHEATRFLAMESERVYIPPTHDVYKYQIRQNTHLDKQNIREIPATESVAVQGCQSENLCDDALSWHVEGIASNLDNANILPSDALTNTLAAIHTKHIPVHLVRRLSDQVHVQFHAMHEFVGMELIVLLQHKKKTRALHFGTYPSVDTTLPIQTLLPNAQYKAEFLVCREHMPNVYRCFASTDISFQTATQEPQPTIQSSWTNPTYILIDLLHQLPANRDIYWQLSCFSPQDICKQIMHNTNDVQGTIFRRTYNTKMFGKRNVLLIDWPFAVQDTLLIQLHIQSCSKYGCSLRQTRFIEWESSSMEFGALPSVSQLIKHTQMQDESLSTHDTTQTKNTQFMPLHIPSHIVPKKRQLSLEWTWLLPEIDENKQKTHSNIVDDSTQTQHRQEMVPNTYFLADSPLVSVPVAPLPPTFTALLASENKQDIAHALHSRHRQIAAQISVYDEVSNDYLVYQDKRTTDVLCAHCATMPNWQRLHYITSVNTHDTVHMAGNQICATDGVATQCYATDGSMHDAYQGFGNVQKGKFLSCGAFAGDTWCWGKNAGGMYPDQLTDTSLPALPFPYLSNALYLAQDYAAVCTQEGEDNALYCWGENPQGILLGQHNQVHEKTFRHQENNAPRTAITLEGSHITGVRDLAFIGNDGVCVITTKLICWGKDSFGIHKPRVVDTVSKNTKFAHTNMPMVVLVDGKKISIAVSGIFAPLQHISLNFVPQFVAMWRFQDVIALIMQGASTSPIVLSFDWNTYNITTSVLDIASAKNIVSDTNNWCIHTYDGKIWCM